MELKKSQGILATANAPHELQGAWAEAKTAAKILGVPKLKDVEDKVWGPKMAGGKKAEFLIDGEPEHNALKMTVKLHIGSEFSTLAALTKSADELKPNNPAKSLLKKFGFLKE